MCGSPAGFCPLSLFPCSGGRLLLQSLPSMWENMFSVFWFFVFSAFLARSFASSSPRFQIQPRSCPWISKATRVLRKRKGFLSPGPTPLYPQGEREGAGKEDVSSGVRLSGCSGVGHRMFVLFRGPKAEC